jgi:DNA helicase TIP49 (TBP-interacting protein)
VLLTRINAPRREIDDITDRIEKNGVSEMFAIENYDVQETRRVSRNEGKAEGKIEDAVSIVKEFNVPVSRAMGIINLPASEQGRVVAELRKLGIPYTAG